MKLFSYYILSLLLGTAVAVSILTGCHNKDSFGPVIMTTASSDISNSSDVEASEQKPAPQPKTESKPEANTELELWEMDYDTYFSQERKFKRDMEDILKLTIDENKIIQNGTEILYQADAPVSDLYQSQNRDLIFFVKGTDTKTIGCTCNPEKWMKFFLLTVKRFNLLLQKQTIPLFGGLRKPLNGKRI